MGRRLDVVRLAALLGCDRVGLVDALNEAEAAFHDLVGIHLLPPQRAWFESGDEASEIPPDASGIPDAVALSTRFLDLLDNPHEVVASTAPPLRAEPCIDAWIGAVAEAVRSRQPLHLAFRCRAGSHRDVADLAALLAGAEVGTVVFSSGHSALAAGLLRAEMHARARSTATVIPVGGLLVVGGSDEDPDDGIAAGRRFADATPFVVESRPWLGSLGGVCIWCVPADAVLPASLDGLIAGCVGPIRPEPSWVRDVVAGAIGAGVGPAGVAAIAATLEDPRDAPARGRAAKLLSAVTGMRIDDACGAVARSFVPSATMPEGSADFDLDLHADDPEIAMLFARAREVALAGGRLLFSGPPGGGKTSLCRALSAEMAKAGAAGPPVTVSAADICVRPYGGSERVLRELWRRAAIARSPLLIDELDSMCGVRDPSGPSGGNAYLVRMLTNEWIRNLDAHPQVPVLATVNDLAVDPAVLRRFTAIHHVGADLSPLVERPRLALAPRHGPSVRLGAVRCRPERLRLGSTALPDARSERCRQHRRRDREGARGAVRRAGDCPSAYVRGTAPLSADGRSPLHRLYVFVASCTGCMRLSGEIGLPLVHVDAALDSAQAVRVLNRTEHGAGVRAPGFCQPVAFDGGWSDWSMFDYAPGPWPGGQARPRGVRVVEGRIAVALPAGVTLADLRGQLRGALRHLRLHEVTSAMAWMEARSEACLDYLVEPRYTANPETRDFRGAVRTDDIYVLDPAERPWLLYWIVVSARLAAIEGAS